jgi:hypothetical protein
MLTDSAKNNANIKLLISVYLVLSVIVSLVQLYNLTRGT